MERTGSDRGGPVRLVEPRVRGWWAPPRVGWAFMWSMATVGLNEWWGRYLRFLAVGGGAVALALALMAVLGRALGLLGLGLALLLGLGSAGLALGPGRWVLALLGVAPGLALYPLRVLPWPLEAVLAVFLGLGGRPDAWRRRVAHVGAPPRVGPARRG